MGRSEAATAEEGEMNRPVSMRIDDRVDQSRLNFERHNYESPTEVHRAR